MQSCWETCQYDEPLFVSQVLWILPQSEANGNHLCYVASRKYQLGRNITMVVRFEDGFHLFLIESISTTLVTHKIVQHIDASLSKIAFPGMLWFSQFLFIQHISWCLHFFSSLWIRTSGMPTRLQPLLWELADVNCFETVLWFTMLSKLFFCMQDGICFYIGLFFSKQLF